MPSVTAIHESLPYIDHPPSPTSLSAAEALITAERALIPDDPHHALLPPPHQPNLTPLLTSEYTRVARGEKLNALDLSRYEAPETPSTDAAPEELTALLSRAYASHAYVSSRRAHLALLDSYGKNAWLIGNWHLEGELKAIEKELAETKKAIDVLTLQRKTAQGEVGGEIHGLEETWKRGIARVLETEAAAESLRREILETRRESA
ncbi:hypothetical protein OQA88_1952 [Cercophora sp. LCS_1]